MMKVAFFTRSGAATVTTIEIDAEAPPGMQIPPGAFEVRWDGRRYVDAHTGEGVSEKMHYYHGTGRRRLGDAVLHAPAPATISTTERRRA